MSRELLFSVTKKDLVVTHLRCGGAGGQHRDKTSNGTRISHPASGASVKVTESRSQHENTRTALRRLVQTPKFQLWLKIKTGELDAASEKFTMSPENLRIEGRERGEWRAIG